MNRRVFAWISLAMLALPPVAGLLESQLTTHMLVLYPALIACGVVLGDGYRSKLARLVENLNRGGIAGILLASFGLAFWMIPRWVDASLDNAWINAAKVFALVALVGVPLALSWRRLHPIAAALIKIEFVTMLLRVGWLYLIAPQRLCNNYLLSDQIWLGRAVLLLAVALAITWLIPVLFGPLAQSRGAAEGRG